MENHLKLFLPLSLKELGLRKVAVLFCSNSDVLKKMYQLTAAPFRIPTYKIKEWLEATKEKLKLGLPKSLNKQVIDRIQAIGFEIRNWKIVNQCGLVAELPDVSKLCWSNAVAIDCRKIAEQHVLSDQLVNWRRYTIACRNCMENHIPLLWNKLSKREKDLAKEEWVIPSPYCLWPCILEGRRKVLEDGSKDAGRTSFNQWAFEESAENSNQVAVEYFYEKMTPEEREVSLMRTAYRWIDKYNILYTIIPSDLMNSNFLFYLLSLMNPGQQMEIVRERPVQVLLCFLDWPRQHLLPENSRLIWTFLPESDYGELLTSIALISTYIDKLYPQFLQEFFKHAPLDFIKKSFVGHEYDPYPPACRVLCALVDNGDAESIEVMFRHADAASRVKLVCCDPVFDRFYYCIICERWDGVMACVREAVLSEEDGGTLKESFMRYLDQRFNNCMCAEPIFRRLFVFLHETDACDDMEKKAKRPKLE